MIKFVPKRWGYEKWVANSHLYCGKILFIAAGQCFSYHYHKIKHETFHVLSGTGKMLIGTDLTPYKEYISYYKVDWRVLKPGTTIEIPAGIPHKVWAETDLTIMEVSTFHQDEDSYRLEVVADAN